MADLRHARYLGLVKTRVQHVLTAAARTICHLSTWFDERPLASVRMTPFVALATVT